MEPYTNPDNLYRAVRLGYPSVQAQFRTVLKNETGHVIDSRVFNTDLNKGSALDWYMTLHIASPGPASVLAPGWYLTRGHEAATSSQTLMTGVSLNGLNTWDVDSLGWVKLGPGGRLVTQSMDQLGRYFVPRSVFIMFSVLITPLLRVENCVSGKTSGHFTR